MTGLKLRAQTGECLRVIDERVCEGMDITGVVGLTAGQRTALKLMGAVEGRMKDEWSWVLAVSQTGVIGSKEPFRCF
ncbi:MAG: hypothetical protein QNJ46_17345 [Leptolyngbyaceae cyanobacterium MO_188.B28]|nr:hypothetical protein [Leptolyngbyaceae cyanobacterium MO_188.B28]